MSDGVVANLTYNGTSLQICCGAVQLVRETTYNPPRKARYHFRWEKDTEEGTELDWDHILESET